MGDKAHWLYNNTYDQEIEELLKQGCRAWGIYVRLTNKYGKQVLSHRTIQQRVKDLKEQKRETSQDDYSRQASKQLS